MRAPLWLSLASLLGCSSVARTPAPRPPAAPLAAPLPPAWERWNSTAVPTPIHGVAALAGSDAVFAARDGIYRWDGASAPRLLCRTDPPATLIEAHDRHFVAVGGSEGAPRVWRSNAADGCEAVSLPSLSLQGHTPGDLHLSLDHDTVFVWTPTGQIARSDDRGAHWRTLPRMDNAQELAAGPGGASLAAALASVGSPQHAARVALYALAAGPDAAWRLVPDVGARWLPMGFQTLAEGSVLVADRAGSITLGPDGAVTARHDHAERWGDRSPPRMFTAVGDGRFLGVGASSLSTVDATVSRAFGFPQGLRAVLSADTAPDGTAWITDGMSVWRGPLDGPITELTERPLDGAPTRMTARGDTVAMANGAGQVALSRDGGARWHRFDPPTPLGAPIAMTLDPHGALLVAMPGALMVCEGDRVSVVETPQRNARTTQRPLLTVFGDRWVYIDGEVFTSDDQGAHWTSRFGPNAPAGAGLVVAAAVDPRDRILVLDQTQTVWRSTDAGGRFTRWAEDPFHDGPALVDAHGGRIAAAPTWPVAIAWDGADEAWILSSVRAAHTRNGGARFEVDNAALTPAETALGPGGSLFVMAESALGGSARCTFTREHALLWAAAGEGFAPVTDACDHQASAWAFDGDHVVIADPVGALSRGALQSLREPPEP